MVHMHGLHSHMHTLPIVRIENSCCEHICCIEQSLNGQNELARFVLGTVGSLCSRGVSVISRVHDVDGMVCPVTNRAMLIN